jgi:hypothetical protein
LRRLGAGKGHLLNSLQDEPSGRFRGLARLLRQHGGVGVDGEGAAARRLTDKGLFAAIIAGVLGVAVLAILTYGFTRRTISGPQAVHQVADHAASNGDALDDPMPPADTAPPADAPTPDPQESTTAEVPLPNPAEPRERGDDHDEGGDEQDDD